MGQPWGGRAVVAVDSGVDMSFFSHVYGAVGLELRRQRCRTVVKNPNRLVSSGPGTPPLPIHDDKSGHIRGVRWNGGGTGTYLPETYGLHGVLATHRCDRDLGAFQLTGDPVSFLSRPRLNQSRESGSSQTPTIRPRRAWIRVAV